MKPKKIDGKTAAEQATACRRRLRGVQHVRRLLRAQGRVRADRSRKPAITKLVTIGKTVNGQDIIAIKVSKDARQQKDGKKPSVLYVGAQHAREWITPEMNRRLMHHVIDNYGSDPKITSLVTRTSCGSSRWPTPTATTSPSSPTSGCGARTCATTTATASSRRGDGVDLNRNFATKWGYDNEGSSPDPSSETYRGTGPDSEPETQAIERLAKRVRFEFNVNYHSAAELLLYGTGMAGLDTDPGRRALRGDGGRRREPCGARATTRISRPSSTPPTARPTPHFTERFGTLGFTPEMSTCEAASDRVPDDEWEADGLRERVQLPRRRRPDPGRVREEHPVRTAVAASAADPDDPVSVVGRTAEDFRGRHVRRLVRRPTDRGGGRPSARSKNERLNYRITGGAKRRPRGCPSGPAASGTATRATTTTPSCAVR